MNILPLKVGMIVTMKKPHPCSSNQFRLVRVGADVGAVCLGCGRELMLPRIKFEKSVKKLPDSEENV